MDRTSFSNSITESVKSRRVVICRNITSVIPCPFYLPYENFRSPSDQTPVSTEELQVMERWLTNKDASVDPGVGKCAQTGVARNLLRVQKRDDKWIALASDAYGISEDNIRDNVDLGGNNVLLAILVDLSRQGRAIHFHDWWMELPTQFDIHDTLPRLQHDFCTLWNENVQKSRIPRHYSFSVRILRSIRHLYIALHQGTDAAPTAFSVSTRDFDVVLSNTSSYPLCDIKSHRPDSTTVPNSCTVPLATQPGHSPDASPHSPSHGGSTVSQQVEKVAGPPSSSDSTTPGGIGDSSRAPAATSATSPVHANPRPTEAPPPVAIAAVLQDTSLAATSSHSLEGTTQRDVVGPCAGPEIGEILSTASSSCDASATSNLTPLPSILFTSIPASPPPSCVLPLPNSEFLALFSGTTSIPPTDNTTLPPIRLLRARGLVNTGSMCFANAVLQLLVHSSPFWDLFKGLGDLKGQRGAGRPETYDSTTPLVDTMKRFFEEFMFREKEPPPTRQPPQQVAAGKTKDEESENEHNAVISFEPTYLYDAMKEKRQLNHLLDGGQQDAEEFFRLYLDALDEELVALHTSMSTDKPASTPKVKVPEEEIRLGDDQTEVGERDFTANSAKSPISRIFGGRSRLTVRAPNQPDTITVEDWRLLQLNTQPNSVHTVEDALAYISQPAQAGQLHSSELRQQVQIKALPPVLVLHLKRFLFDAAADGIVKIGKSIQFAPELEIPLEIMAPVFGKSVEPAHYKLYGVLYHHGESTSSGHYTVDMLHLNGDSSDREGWLHIDDEVVSAVRHEDVFRAHENERGDGRSAYMLFYRRTASALT